MEKTLCVHIRCNIKDVKGFIKNRVEEKIYIPLSLKPPKEDSELKLFIQNYWVKKQLEEHGAGPKGEHPEIEVTKITYKELV
jgi:hypothetical protein